MVARARSNLKAVETYLGTVELDEVGEARAQIARTLAAKLDGIAGSTVASDNLAIPAIAKGLREVLDELVDLSGETESFTNGLFAAVGDSADG